MNLRWGRFATYCLIFAGCIELSVENDATTPEFGGSDAMWLIPLAVGLIGFGYLLIVKREKSAAMFGAPAVIIGLCLSVWFPSTLTRVIVLAVFCLVILRVVRVSRSEA